MIGSDLASASRSVIIFQTVQSVSFAISLPFNMLFSKCCFFLNRILGEF